MGERTAVEVDVSGVTADVAMVDLLARMALAARRRGHELRLRGASPELVELIELAGLAEALPAATAAAAARRGGRASRSRGRT